MIVSAAFIFFALLAIAGASGMLVFQKVLHCAYSFLLCCVAATGLCLLLDLPFLALAQLFTVVIAGSLIVGISTGKPEPATSRRLTLKVLPVAFVFMAIVTWAITRGRIGEPILQSIPMWAVHGERIAAFGQTVLDSHLVPLELVGVFLLASIVSVTHLIRQSRKSSDSDELTR